MKSTNMQKTINIYLNSVKYGMFVLLLIVILYHSYFIYNEYNEKITLFTYSLDHDCVVSEKQPSNNFIYTKKVYYCDDAKAQELIITLYNWYIHRIIPIIYLLIILIIIKLVLKTDFITKIGDIDNENKL